MNSQILHNVKHIPFNERETFNNAILLLSMVKSEYYYIVGFSRPDNKIVIGFDFENKIYGNISETVTIDFSGNTKGISVSTQLKNIVFKDNTVIPLAYKDKFSITNEHVFYNRLFEKDDIIPVSMDKLNSIILLIKKDIGDFIEYSMEYILKTGKRNED